MKHLKTFENFVKESSNKVVAEIKEKDGDYIITCKGESEIVSGKAVEEDKSSTLEKVCELAKKMGATHLYNESAKPQEVAVTEIIHYIMSGTKKGLFQGQQSHKGFWEIMQGEKPAGAYA